jgi:peptidoglycan/LPS O-acetylase OafA/YrhL
MSSDKSSRFTLVLQQVVFLDLVRAVAASAVVVQHLILMTRGLEFSKDFYYGTFGVTTFFLISGFLIDQSVQKHALGMAPPRPQPTEPAATYGLREFLIDRTARIYVCFVPALIFTASIVATLSHRPDFVGEPHFGLTQFIGNLLMLQDYPAFQLARRVGLDASWFIRPYALAEPYWTVPIELYLYIGFGVAYFWYVKRAGVPQLSIWAAAAIAALPILYHAATGFGQCLTLTWLLGVAGSRLMSGRLAAPKPAFIVAWVSVSLIMLGLRILSRGFDFADLQKSMFWGMLLLGGLWAAPHLRWLAHPVIKAPAAFFAKISYALYLTHNVLLGWTVMHFGRSLSALQIGLAFVACQVCAFVFWWAFDRHYKAVARWLRNLGVPASAAPQRTLVGVSAAAAAQTAESPAQRVPPVVG